MGRADTIAMRDGGQSLYVNTEQAGESAVSTSQIGEFSASAQPAVM